MSDFLHNLRTGNMKRYDRPRKNYDNPQYRGHHDRQYNKDRKGSYQKKTPTGDQLQDIKKHLEVIARITESNLKTQEKAASALERIAMVLETAVGIKPATPAVQADIREQQTLETEKIPEPVEKASETHVDSEKTLLETIIEMRNGGASFDKIAGELEKKQIPTVSGRGRWRGQAVSKLLKSSA